MPPLRGFALLCVLAAVIVVAPLAAQSPPGCAGSSPLGTFRILVRRGPAGPLLPLKSVSALPAGLHLIWEPVHLPHNHSDSAEVTAILVSSGEDLVVLKPHKAGVRTEWQMPIRPVAIALVLGPQGLSESKVKSLITHNEELVEQLADYADQTSKVESLVQELSNAEQSGDGADAALKGISARYGVALPKLDSTTSTNQQAGVLLKALLPTATSYDPLAAQNSQMQQSVGLAASVAGLFFGNAVGLAAGGTSLLTGIKGALFPGTEFRSAFAQTDDKDSLALCTKASPQKARTRIAYLWAYRVPNLKPPVLSLPATADLPVGVSSTIGLTPAKGSTVKPVEKAAQWRLIPVAGGDPQPVTVHLAPAADSIAIDLAHPLAHPGDYHLAATWDWDPLAVTGILHLRPLSDFSHVQLGPESRNKLIEGKGIVTVKLTGADFEFLEKAAISKAGAHPPAATDAHFVLPLGKRAGTQDSVTIDIDTAARGAYLLSLTQSDGHAHEVPFTVLPPDPVLSNLPLRVNQGESFQPLLLDGTGLGRIEVVSSDAGEIKGAAGASGWSGAIRLKPGAAVGAIFALSLKVKGLDSPLTVPAAIKVFGPRPVITGVKKAVPDTLGVSMRPDELPAGLSVGLSLEVRQFRDPSAKASDRRPRVELGCRSGGLHQSITLSPDDHIAGARLTVASAGLLFLSIDPDSVGDPGCQLTATVDVEPEGRSDPFAIGRVVRIPRLEQFTLTTEQIDPSTYVGILKGRDLDVIEKTGWDEHHGLSVDSIPTPIPGQPSLETLRIALPWPSPSPHAPLYLWLRGEEDGRKTAVSY